MEEQKSKEADGKKTATKTGRKVRKTSQLKKAPNSPEFIELSREEEENHPRIIKDYKESPLLGVKEEAQNLFDLRKDSKNLSSMYKC